MLHLHLEGEIHWLEPVTDEEYRYLLKGDRKWQSQKALLLIFHAKEIIMWEVVF